MRLHPLQPVQYNRLPGDPVTSQTVGPFFNLDHSDFLMVRSRGRYEAASIPTAREKWKRAKAGGRRERWYQRRVAASGLVG